MPTARGITVSLQSQYDALTIPEEPLPPSPTLINLHSSSPDYSPTNETRNQTPSHQTAEVTIPTFPCSQFWISYKCPPPRLSKSKDKDVIQFYYFKLFAATEGPCISSWGVGEQDRWRGKTMFALFDAGTDFEGRRVVEKRGLFFPPSSVAGEGFEIHVFRAKARKSRKLEYEVLEEGDANAGTFDLTSIGRVKRGERQRQYTYALIDAKDEPFVKFKYRFRPEDVDDESTCSGVSTASIAVTDLSIDHAPDLASAQMEARLFRRLSVPPRTILAPTTSRSEPFSPVKTSTYSRQEGGGGADVDLGEQKRREWFTRTPSPMVSRLFDRPATPPVQRRKAGSSELLKDILVNALKGKGGR